MKRLLLLIIFALVGCSTTRYVNVPEYHTDSIYIDKIRYDSIFTDRYHNHFIKGDTVYLRDSIYVYKLKTLKDTVSIFKVDTIYKPQIVEVERKPSVFDKLKYIWFWVITILAFLFLIKIFRCTRH